MGKTSIEWTDASWNPIVGCTEVSPGCANCYAARLAASRLKNHPDYKGLAEMHIVASIATAPFPRVSQPRWTGRVRSHQDRFEEPLRWRKPRKIFVCDMSDLFHPDVQFSSIGGIWCAMAKCPQHTFQVLTKRPQRMLEFMRWAEESRQPIEKNADLWGSIWPLPNVWIGVSVENQHFADARIPLLLQTPAAVRFISAEPLLGPVDFGEPIRQWCRDHQLEDRTTSLDWIIAGGESGPHARPMHPEWVRGIRDWCQSRGDVCGDTKQAVPFFFKQWGEWLPSLQERVGLQNVTIDDLGPPRKVGKKKAGRLLDGREWNEFPAPKP